MRTLAQLIKIKLTVGHRATDATEALDEEEKVKLLLGDRHLVSLDTCRKEEGWGREGMGGRRDGKRGTFEP